MAIPYWTWPESDHQADASLETATDAFGVVSNAGQKLVGELLDADTERSDSPASGASRTGGRTGPLRQERVR